MIFNLIKKHSDLFTFLSLCIIFYFIFFFGIGSYPLMDIDETRYASMAHDMFRSKEFMTLYLNGDYFFEKPPLYFWLECLSFSFFGKVNEFTVRFPIAMLGTLCSFLLYFIGKKVISKNFGITAALVLATSLEFLILSKFAILDMVLVFCTTFSILFGFMTLFCEEKNKKWFWWLFYSFSGLAVMAKGILGFILPFGIIFLVYITAKKLREIFKPLYLFPGIIIFTLIVLPWHFLMLQKHNPLFFDEYIMKHHIARFTTSEYIGRKKPVWFFIVTIIWGFFPWIIPFLVMSKNWFCKILQLFKNGFDFNNFNSIQKFIIINAIAVIFILTFFSISSSKLITYILPIYPFLAYLTSAIILEYGKSQKTNLLLSTVTITAGIIFFIAGCTEMFFIPLLPLEISGYVVPFKPIAPVLIIGGLTFIILACKNLKKYLFISIVIFMTILSAVCVPIAFNFDYIFGQNDLIQFALTAKNENKKLVSFGFGKRYSLNFYYEKHVIYEKVPNFNRLKDFLKNSDTVIVIKNKDLDEYKKHVNFQIISQGYKYSLIKRINDETYHKCR